MKDFEAVSEGGGGAFMRGAGKREERRFGKDLDKSRSQGKSKV